MNQTIDPIKLKAAAEHLEWVLICRSPAKPKYTTSIQGHLSAPATTHAGYLHK